MGTIYLVQHAEKRREPGDPSLTETGQAQAVRTGTWLARAGLTAVYSSPLRRARQTAAPIAAAAGLDVRLDDRLRERMNWDGGGPFEEFLADWEASVRDRDFMPGTGDSSRQAGARLLAFVRDRTADLGPVAAVTHGGVTGDLLRTLLGDAGVPAELLHHGVPPGAITVLEAGAVVTFAGTDHLR